MTRLFAPFLPYIAGAVLAALVGLSVALWWQTVRVDSLKAENDALSAQLRAEKARVILLRNEMESDRAIDQIPDNDLPGAVDCRWLARRRLRPLTQSLPFAMQRNPVALAKPKLTGGLLMRQPTCAKTSKITKLASASAGGLGKRKQSARFFA